MYDDSYRDVAFNLLKTNVLQFIGIDIAKSTFVAAYPLPTGGYRTKTYPNDPKGVALFMKSFSQEGYHCVLEATGNYGMLLLYMLCKAGVAVSQVNPKQIKHFARMMMTVTKTDDVYPPDKLHI